MIRLCPVLLALAMVLPAQAQKELRWRFVKGQKFTTTFVNKQTQKMTVMGGPVTIKINQTITGVREVVAVDADGTATVVDTTKRLVSRVENSMQGVKVTVDTNEAAPADPTGAMMHGQLKALVGMKTTMKVTARGEVKDAKIEGGGQAAAQMKGALRSSMLKFPEKPVAVGANWKDEFTIEQPQLTMKTETTYTYQGPAGTDEKITSTAKVTPQGGNPMMTVKVTKQDVQGVLLFDAAKGYLRSSRVKTVMTLQITAGGQVIDQVLDQSSSFTCKLAGANPELSEPTKKKDDTKNERY